LPHGRSLITSPPLDGSKHTKCSLRCQSTLGLTFGLQNTSFSMASTVSGIGSTTVSFPTLVVLTWLSGNIQGAPPSSCISALLTFRNVGTWHPLGRVTGGTLYPGLMVTSGVIYKILRFFTFPVDIRNVCVLLAPGFSGLTSTATYLLTYEVSGSPSAGLLAAVFMGITPGYISRSVAGSYDNEAIAIFLLGFTFYLWIKALKNGSAMWGALTALFYGYMVSAWGGYVFITNLLPLHAFVLICMGRYSPRLYVSYSTWFALGTLASMQVPFVGFLPIRSSDHMSALGKQLRIARVQTILIYQRGIWIGSARRFCRFHPHAAAEQAVSNSSPRNGSRHFRRRLWWSCFIDRLWCCCALEWTLLLALGHRLRQNSYSHHRLRF